MTKKQIAKFCSNYSESILLADGFEAAFVGVGSQFSNEPVAIYDRAKCLAILMERDGMTEEESEEFFDFNVQGAWVGDQTPIFMEFAQRRV